MLGDAERSFFAEHGYLILRGLVAPDLRATAGQALRRALAVRRLGRERRLDLTRRDGTLVRVLWHLHRECPELGPLLHHPGVGAALSALMGDTPEVRLWHDQVFHKGPRSGGAVGWHQDYAYERRARPADLVTATVALTRSGRHNGGLEVLPGSHRWGLLRYTLGDAYADQPQTMLEREVFPEYGVVAPTVLELEPGDVSFHHCLLVHGSPANRSAEERLNYILHAFGAHVRYAKAGSRPWQWNITVADGEPIRGPDFPVMWQRSP